MRLTTIATIALATLLFAGCQPAPNRETAEAGGPVRIGQMSGDTVKLGFVPFISFMALLSINLGLINLLPVPMLDGGHLVFYAIEAVRGKPLGERARK